MLVLRRFTDSGIDAFQDVLDRMAMGDGVDVDGLLEHPLHTQPLSDEDVVEVRSFVNRFDAAEHLYRLLEPYESILGDVERDRGLWAWLSAAWLDLLAPRDEAGMRKLRARARWVPAVDDYKTYYRHLLGGPYRIYRAHRADPARAMAVLATAVASPGDVVEQLASRQEIISSPELMQAITDLYYEPEKGKLKAGAATKSPGSARRLVDVIQQFDLTWDVYGMEAKQFLDLLPAEFDRFKKR